MVKQTRSQILGRKGERWFESVLPAEWTYEKPSVDIGQDGTVTIERRLLPGDSAEIGEVEFHVQIKASASWTVKSGGYVRVGGIGRDTLGLWASRLAPTVLVLYDEKLNAGFYAWVFDSIEPATLTRLVREKQKTLTLRVPTMNRLAAEDECWNALRAQATAYRDSMLNAREFTAVMKPILRCVRRVSKTLEPLISTQDLAEDPGSDAALWRGVLEIKSHRELLGAVDELVAAIPMDHPLSRQLRMFGDAYFAGVRSYLHPFEREEPKGAYGVWTDDKLRWPAAQRLLAMQAALVQMLVEVGAR